MMPEECGEIVAEMRSFCGKELVDARGNNPKCESTLYVPSTGVS